MAESFYMDDEDGAQAFAELAKPRVERDVLLAELQHGIRNLLGRIRSVTRRMAETSVDVQDYASHLEGRLGALTRLQILPSDDTNGVGLDGLIADELVVYRAREGEQFTLEGPIVRLVRRAAESLCLAFHELATNALKFGALAAPGGHIAVSWTIDGAGQNGRLILLWRETGGLPVPPGQPSHRGFGLDVLTRAIPYEIAAVTSLDFKPSGLECSIVLPAGAWLEFDKLSN